MAGLFASSSDNVVACTSDSYVSFAYYIFPNLNEYLIVETQAGRQLETIIINSQASSSTPSSVHRRSISLPRLIDHASYPQPSPSEARTRWLRHKILIKQHMDEARRTKIEQEWLSNDNTRWGFIKRGFKNVDTLYRM